MSVSGIQVDDEVAVVYNQMKLKKDAKFLVFQIVDKKFINLKETGAPPAKPTESKEDDRVHFNKLKEIVTAPDPESGKRMPAYVLYDFGFTLADGRIVSKLAFIFWCPDTCPIGAKMIYASSKDSVKKAFTGIGLEFQANDVADFDYDELVAEVEKKA